MTYYDDNFGHWDKEHMEDPDAVAFYHQVQAESIWKRCHGCGGIKKLRPEYYLCDGCATKVEQGMDLENPDIPNEDVDLELQILRAKQGVDDEIHKRKQAEDEAEAESLG